jgi:hypothetical protein
VKRERRGFFSELRTDSDAMKSANGGQSDE